MQKFGANLSVFGLSIVNLSIYSISLGALLSSSIALSFKTQFVSLDLPANWGCIQEELDWVCQPDNLAERSEAMIVIVTKSVNEADDTLDKYLEILSRPKDMRDLIGKPYKSQVKFARKRDIRNQAWIDSLQLGSEVPGFYTRYLASTKDKVAALVSYSVGESVYPKWAEPMDRMIDSLDIFFDPEAFSELMAKTPSSLLGARSGRAGFRGLPTSEDENVDTKPIQEPVDTTMIGGILLVLAVLGYVIYKKKKGS